MPKARRTGRIYQRGADSWLVSLYLGTDAVGKRKIHYKTIRGKRKDAQKYLNKIIREKDLGTFVDTPAMSLSEYFDK